MKTRWHISAHPMGIICLLAAFFLMPIRQLIAALLAITLHEGAHLLAIVLCKVSHCSVEWTPFGFVAQADGFSFMSPGKRVWIALAGLLASGFLAALFWPLATQNINCYIFFMANVTLLFINSLPILPLDGGRVLLALAAVIHFERCAKKTLLLLSYIIAGLITGLGLYAAWKGLFNPSLLVLGPYLAYAAHQNSLQGTAETVQMISRREHPTCGVYPVETWAVVGQMDHAEVIKILRHAPAEKFVLFHTIDPKSGKMITVETQQQMIVKLVDEM